MTRFKRTSQTKKPTAVLTADWHLRSDTPIGRTDDYFAAMERKIDFILALSEQHECPILIAGDLGHKSQWPNWLLEWAIEKFKEHDIICIPGQHDLPNHRLDQWEKAGVGVLHAAGAIELLGPHDLGSDYMLDNICIDAFPYGESIHSIKLDSPFIKVAMAHQPIVEILPRWPGDEGSKSHQLLKKFPEYSLILTGDNHQSFSVKAEGRGLVNPGSMMRNTADQENHKPRVYLWYAETNEIEPIYLPIELNVIDRTHIDNIQERDDRFNALITRVKNDVEIQLSYEQNIENYFQKYRTEKLVKEKVWQAVI